jgi:hypothetical protein
MLDLQSFIQAAIPAVDPLDIERFWTLQSQHPREPGVAFSTIAISEVCESPSADPIAVWARTTLIIILLEQGQLGNWLEDGRPDTVVFATAAVFPLPAGLQQFDPDEFLANLPTA